MNLIVLLRDMLTAAEHQGHDPVAVMKKIADELVAHTHHTDAVKDVETQLYERAAELFTKEIMQS